MTKPDNPRRSCLVVLLAAGGAERFGSDKLAAPLGDYPVAAWSLRAFAASPLVDAIQPVGSEANLGWLAGLAKRHGAGKALAPCLGGSARSLSTLRGLEAASGNWHWVMVHDAARPFVDAALISDGLDAAAAHGSAIAAQPSSDTVQIVDENGIVCDTPDRRRSWLAQTPQIATYHSLLEAHRACAGRLASFTDEASVLRAGGQMVAVYEGNGENLKITTPPDLALARAMIQGHKRFPRGGGST